jgi:hypothetical protein
MKGSASISGWIMVRQTAKPPSPTSSRRAKIGVAPRCGHNRFAVRPIRISVARPESAEISRGQMSVSPKACHARDVSHGISGAILGSAAPSPTGTRPPSRYMCQEAASISNSMGAVGGRMARPPSVRITQNRYGATIAARQAMPPASPSSRGAISTLTTSRPVRLAKQVEIDDRAFA